MNSLDFAIKTEIDGAAFYSGQAQKNKGTTLQRVFDLLAQEELQHEDILRQVAADIFSDLPEKAVLTNTKSIFSSLDNFRDEIRENPSQVEVYRLARDMEQKSIDMYQKMLEEVQTEKEKTILLFLVKQETHHFQMIDEFVIRIGRPDEWVESAEFGPREDY